MASVASLPSWTVDGYLEWEATSDRRHEFVDGAVYALAGGSRTHAAIAVNIATLLRNALRGTACSVYSSDLKVRASATRFLYPDVSVGCGADAQPDDATWLTAPWLVVEVLSSSTATYDRGDKLTYYQQIPSLREYVLVETERRLVEVHSRGQDGAWSACQCSAGEAVVPSLGLRLAINGIYADVPVP